VAQFSQIEHCVEAILPSAKLASVLEIPQNQACLKVCRKVYANHGVVSYARLYHAGNRFHIGTKVD
jgi:GntR family histidine utilization transcriptional repressor